MYQCIVFDKDGTIFDTKSAAVGAFTRASKELNIEYLPDVLFGLVGIENEIICQKLLLAQNSDIDPKIYGDLVHKYFTLYSEDGHLMFGGMLDLFIDLKEKGVKMFVATGNNRYNTDKLLADNNLVQYFDLVMTADDVARGKPNPEMLQVIADYCNIPKQKMIMIGDSKQDIFMAQNFGCDSVGVSWGMQPRDELLSSSPTFMVDNIDELRNILLS